MLSHSVTSDSVTTWTVACQALLSMGIHRARILEWVAMPSSRGSSQPRDQTHGLSCNFCIAGEFFTTEPLREPKSLQSCLTLCDPMDCSPLGSSVHGILQGKNIEVGCHFLLQGIFLTQGSNMCLLYLLHCKQNLYC